MHGEIDLLGVNVLHHGHGLPPGLVVVGVDVSQVFGRVPLLRDVVVADVALAVDAVGLKLISINISYRKVQQHKGLNCLQWPKSEILFCKFPPGKTTCSEFFEGIQI